MWPTAAIAGDLTDYVTARTADAAHRTDLAAASYARALAGAPGNPLIAIRAYREALAAGDLDLARRAAATLTAAGVAPADVPLLGLAEAAHRNDPAAADAAIAQLAEGRLAVLAPALRGWVAFARGADPLPPLATGKGDGVAVRLADEQRALLLIATGRTAEGVAALDLLRTGGPAIELRLAAAALLAGGGHRDQAHGVLAGDDPLLVAARADPGERPSLGFGVAHLLARLAADLSTGDQPNPLVLALTRAAVTADPADDRARLLLADALARTGALNRALAALEPIAATSAFAAPADAERIAFLAAQGRAAEALAAARGAAERADAGSAEWQVYADLLVAGNQPAEAAAYYRRTIDAGAAGDWAAWLRYGSALDQAGRWAEAEPALAKAVALGPQQPVALNYLGYARLAHGGDKAASVRLLQRAAALAPDDLSIADSLGWAWYLAGDTGRALPLIERAAAGEPANAEIAEHLGDAYWSLGRRYEARYAWRAAAVTADAADATRLADKIAHGLPAGQRH